VNKKLIIYMIIASILVLGLTLYIFLNNQKNHLFIYKSLVMKELYPLHIKREIRLSVLW